MKTYYKDYDELARDWVAGTCADGAHTDRNRMIAYSSAIFSYGSHFCIARKWTAPDTGRTWYLVTLRSYSPTTGKHITRVSRAIPSPQLIYLPQVDDLTDVTPDPLKRLDPNYRINLLGPTATEADLGNVVVMHEIQNLDSFVATYLRSRAPYDFDCVVQTRFGNASASVQRFGQELPARFESAKDQCHAHYHARTERNRILASTLPARRRLLAA